MRGRRVFVDFDFQAILSALQSKVVLGPWAMLYGLTEYHTPLQDITCNYMSSWKNNYKSNWPMANQYKKVFEVTFDVRVSRSDTILVADHPCVY